MRIILASNSPRRKKILKLLNFKFDVIPSYLNEKSIHIKQNDSSEYCKYLAFEKAKKVNSKYPESITIGGDTIVIINNQILEKPNSFKEAIKMLTMLSNAKHQVITAISIHSKELNIEHTFIEKTIVTFNKITKEEIIHYVDKFKPLDKSGAYGIQDYSSIFVSKIDGCFYNVVGFPISRFYNELKKLKLNDIFFNKVSSI